MRTGREYVLAEALEDLAPSYDFVLLDCSPSLGVLTLNALTAADVVLIPLQCETLSHRGVGHLLDTVREVQKRTNRDLEVLGVLPTLFDSRTNHSRAVLADVERPLRPGRPRAAHPQVGALRRGARDRALGAGDRPYVQGGRGLPRARPPARRALHPRRGRCVSRDSGFDRIRPRVVAPDPEPVVSEVPTDHAGRQALWSDVVEPPSFGSVTIACSSCAQTSIVGIGTAARAAVPSLHLPIVRRRVLVLDAVPGLRAPHVGPPRRPALARAVDCGA